MNRQRVWKRNLDVRTGVEGPSYDVYGYEEAIVEINDRRIILHCGLLNWIRIDGRTYYPEEVNCNAVFDQLTGFESITQVYRAIEKRNNRRKNWCCRYHAEWIKGLPGESFLRCKKCGKFLDSIFDASAVI